MQYIILLAITTITSNFYANAQKVPEDYLIGKWESIDSSTGIKEEVQFGRNDMVSFFGKDESEWKFSIQIKDSIIYLVYDINLNNVTLHNEGTLIIQNKNCFWWFNPNSYNEYIKALKNGYNFTYKGKFEVWLRENRQVYYRIITKRKA